MFQNNHDIVNLYCYYEKQKERLTNETPTVCGLAADNNNKVHMELMIFLWNNH